MAEMADARAELDRWGGELHERVAELVAVCTPGAEVRPPAEPRVADWHEPVRYRHTLTVRATRDPAVAPAALAERAAAALAAAGWTVHREAPDGPDGPLIVSGTRPELALRVRFSTTSTVVLYTGETAAVALRPPASLDAPPPVRTADDVDDGYLLCYECAGTGWCPQCHGRGWIPDEQRGRRRCPECFDRRVCPVCEGAGQLAVATLTPAQRANYGHQT
ncbi:hypothetical protein [Nocardia farcinica]|uniref:hypothetical protein n=1 Tax=Nocardia farcinica TaxID=37329 RepID=UPI0015F08414|nr:hypothetical protein [Nocardia farcinica]MBA4857218.1 hypothetical protein [Nocardia farcinica]MBC9818688.1 hypothetical protein [Nocardia farcinica]MBF6138608.1 hypothetical protein [Nocardia farcinica]MBF6268366.1 hypothetical protein [Nocardia farcinica]MBF6373763.1 hypothetical protein [Nocardia farcinica]